MDNIQGNYKEFIKNNELILKLQQRFTTEKHNVFTEDCIECDDKRIHSVDSIETYAYGTSKDLISEKEDIKCNNITKQYK